MYACFVFCICIYVYEQLQELELNNEHHSKLIIMKVKECTHGYVRTLKFDSEGGGLQKDPSIQTEGNMPFRRAILMNHWQEDVCVIIR